MLRNYVLVSLVFVHAGLGNPVASLRFRSVSGGDPFRYDRDDFLLLFGSLTAKRAAAVGTCISISCGYRIWKVAMAKRMGNLRRLSNVQNAPESEIGSDCVNTSGSNCDFDVSVGSFWSHRGDYGPDSISAFHMAYSRGVRRPLWET